MAHVRIVTDATAQVSADLVARHKIRVLPLEIRLGDTKFVIGPGDSAKPVFERLCDGPAESMQVSVSPQIVLETYRQLHQETDEVLVIVSSATLSSVFETATAQTRTFLGRCRIIVTDSMSTCWGLGLTVEAAAKAAEAGKSLDQIERLIRGILPHLYTVLIVERLDYLERWRRIGPSQALLGSMLHIKPLLIIENGDVVPMEKVRTRTLAVEKVADFVAEFAAVQRAVILRSPIGDGVDELQAALRERLGEVMPKLRFPIVEYDPVLACHVGPEAFGVAVYEGR